MYKKVHRWIVHNKTKKAFFCNAWSRLEGVVILCDKVRACMKHSENFFRKQNSPYLPCWLLINNQTVISGCICPTEHLKEEDCLDNSQGTFSLQRH